MDGPIIVATDDAQFRIVRITEGDRVTYVMEVPDGCDALGVERWREFKLDNRKLQALRDWIVRTAMKGTSSVPKDQ